MPAAAVIPAPIAYIKVVAVKKLVVECLAWVCGAASGCAPALRHASRGVRRAFTGSAGNPSRVLYCEKIRVFKAGVLA